MRRVVLGLLLGFACLACAQQPVGDVYESGGAGAESPAQAVRALYKITATITDDPSSGYDAKTSDWPEADADQQQWDNSMASKGNTLTQQQHAELVPCAAHLNNALDDAERGYRIQISQQNNSAAQATVKKLYASGRSEFEQCNLANVLDGSNGNPATAGNSPGSGSGGTPAGGVGTPIKGGVSATRPGGAPGNLQTTAPQSGNGQGGKSPAGGGSPSNGTPGQGQPGSSQPGSGNRADPANPLSNTVDYLHGLIDGMGDGFKGFGDLTVGAAFFAKGITGLATGQGLGGDDFTNAAKAWGLTPGQSITLKGIAAELNTPVVGSNISAYDQGRTGGRRILSYAVAPAALEAGGSLLGSHAPGPAGANPLKGSAVAGDTAANPLNGQALLDATSGDTPAALANKFIKTAKGPVQQLGRYAGGGSFGQVFGLSKLPRVIKLSTTFEDSAPSFPRQVQGAQRLQSAGVDTPTIYSMEPGGPGQAASMVMDDVPQKWAGAKQYSVTEFTKEMGEAQYNQVLAAADQVYKKLANAGFIGGDLSIGNMMFQPNGAGGLAAIVHDADMIFTSSEMEAEFSQAKSYPGNAVRTTLMNDPSFEPFNETVESLMDKLYKANFPTYENRLPPPPASIPRSGTVPSRPGTGTLPSNQ